MNKYFDTAVKYFNEFAAFVKEVMGWGRNEIVAASVAVTAIAGGVIFGSVLMFNIAVMALVFVTTTNLIHSYKIMRPYINENTALLLAVLVGGYVASMGTFGIIGFALNLAIRADLIGKMKKHGFFEGPAFN